MDKKAQVVKDILNQLITYKAEARIYGESDLEDEEPRGQDWQSPVAKKLEYKDEAVELIRDSLIPPIARKLPKFEAQDPWWRLIW